MESIEIVVTGRQVAATTVLGLRRRLGFVNRVDLDASLPEKVCTTVYISTSSILATIGPPSVPLSNAGMEQIIPSFCRDQHRV